METSVTLPLASNRSEWSVISLSRKPHPMTTIGIIRVTATYFRELCWMNLKGNENKVSIRRGRNIPVRFMYRLYASPNWLTILLSSSLARK
jgi:hypothetical protein